MKDGWFHIFKGDEYKGMKYLSRQEQSKLLLSGYKLHIAGIPKI